MSYSNAKLKSSGDRASPCFRPFLIGNAPDKCLPMRISLKVSFSETLVYTYESTWRHNPEYHYLHRRENLKSHILISLTIFMGIANSVRILNNTSLVTES
jgi:hypothetical protein